MKKKGPWGVLVAIVLAVFFGNFVGETGAIAGVTFYSAVDLLGKIFLNALMLLVVPLVSSSIITGVSRVGNEGGFGRLGLKMLSFYLATSLLAVLIGLFFVNLIGPGLGSDMPPIATLPAFDTQNSLKNLLLQFVPPNIFLAFSQGQMLGLIFFSLIFGYAISKIEAHLATQLQHFFAGVFQTMIQVTHIIMRFLPYGVFCLVAKVAMTTGFQSLRSLALFSVTVLLGLFVFMGIGLPLFLRLIGKVSPWKHVKAMAPALITAFSTSSSSATLPITIDCVEKRAGVSNRICSLVVPLGTSINMSGSALYECVAALFVAQVYGIEVSLTMQFLAVIVSLVASIGVAGVPSGSLVAILLILNAMGLPAEGMGLFVAVDRLLDMCRTTANVFSDSCCAVLVARSEGEKTLL